jgi:hypothetical protein
LKQQSKSRYLIKDEERGHRPPLSPDEPTINRSLSMPTSYWQHCEEQSNERRGAGKYIRNLVETDMQKAELKQKGGRKKTK